MNNSQVVGFYFMVFQSQFNGYVKCWIDGDENWEYYSAKELIDKVKMLPNSYPLLQNISEYLTESSFFLWDVDNETVERLSPRRTTESLKKELKGLIKEKEDFNQPVMNNKGVISFFSNFWKGIKN